MLKVLMSFIVGIASLGGRLGIQSPCWCCRRDRIPGGGIERVLIVSWVMKTAEFGAMAARLGFRAANNAPWCWDPWDRLGSE